MQRLFSEATDNLVLLDDTTRIDPANEGKLLFFDGWARVGDEPSDSLYGVGGHYLAVRRDVRYFQWVEHQEREEYRDADGARVKARIYYSYTREWGKDPVNSDQFHASAAVSRKNFVLVSVRSSSTAYSRRAHITCYELHHELIDSAVAQPADSLAFALSSDTFQRALDSTTRHGAVTCHLIDNTLYYGNDPDYPQVGDVRVTFTLTPECHAWVMAQAHGSEVRPFKSSKDYWVTFCRFSCHQIDPENELSDEAHAQNILLWVLRVLGVDCGCAWH